MKASNGFASVAYDSRRKQLVPEVTNRKDVEPLKAQIQGTSEHGRTTDKRATATVRIDLQKPQPRLKIRRGR